MDRRPTGGVLSAPLDLSALILHIEAAADALRAEALALPADAFVPMPARERYSGSPGAWSACLLRVGRWATEFPGVDLEANAALCPVADALVRTLPVSTVAGFLRLEPGAVLDIHADPREDDELRAHLALQLPEEEARTWPIGTVRLLDTRTPHGARNPSAVPRITFVVDLRLGGPFAGVLPPWG